MILFGDDVPDHLAAQLLADWAHRRGVLAPGLCQHPASSRAWVSPGSELLCPGCCDQRGAELVQQLEAGALPCRTARCHAPATVIAQLPWSRTRRAGASEVVLVGFWCADCSDPLPDLEDAA